MSRSKQPFRWLKGQLLPGREIGSGGWGMNGGGGKEFLPLYGNAPGALYLAYDEYAVKASHALYIAQSIEHKVLIILHVTGIYLDKEIEIATGVVTFGNLADVLHGVHKLLNELVGVLFEAYVA